MFGFYTVIDIEMCMERDHAPTSVATESVLLKVSNTTIKVSYTASQGQSSPPRSSRESLSDERLKIRIDFSLLKLIINIVLFQSALSSGAQAVVGSIVWAFRRLKKPRCREMSARGYVCLQLSFFSPVSH